MRWILGCRSLVMVAWWKKTKMSGQECSAKGNGESEKGWSCLLGSQCQVACEQQQDPRMRSRGSGPSGWEGRNGRAGCQCNFNQNETPLKHSGCHAACMWIDVG